MTEALRYRIIEVLNKYGVKLKAAPLDALVMAFGHMERECCRPHLGLATTGQLLDEIRARIEIHSPDGLNYRTVGGEEIVARSMRNRQMGRL